MVISRFLIVKSVDQYLQEAEAFWRKNLCSKSCVMEQVIPVDRAEPQGRPILATWKIRSRTGQSAVNQGKGVFSLKPTSRPMQCPSTACHLPI